MAQLRVVIVDGVRGTKTLVELPSDVPVGTIISALLSKWQLPSQHDGNPVVYRLIHSRTGNRLEDDETLSSIGIQDGEVIWLDIAVFDEEASTISKENYLVKLRQILSRRFDEGELRTLCFDSGMDYDSLPGTGKADKARELVAYFERRERIPDLVRIGKQLRPDISWEREKNDFPRSYVSVLSW
jgi:hypothetical protein